jgi:hypothetical protein
VHLDVSAAGHLGSAASSPSARLDAWDVFADAAVAECRPHPPAPAVESVQGVLGERRAGLLVRLVALDDPLRPRAVPRSTLTRSSCTDIRGTPAGPSVPFCHSVVIRLCRYTCTRTGGTSSRNSSEVSASRAFATARRTAATDRLRAARKAHATQCWTADSSTTSNGSARSWPCARPRLRQVHEPCACLRASGKGVVDRNFQLILTQEFFLFSPCAFFFSAAIPARLKCG